MLGYSCAITEAAVQLSVACVEGNEELPRCWKNLPSPSVMVGLSRENTTLSASFTIRLFTMASPESNPVSRDFGRPCQLPHTYMLAGSAARPTSPASEMWLLKVIASGFDLARAMLCWSLPIRRAVVPARGISHAASFFPRWNGLDQIFSWSAGRLKMTRLIERSCSGATSVDAGFCWSFCDCGHAGALATIDTRTSNTT